jgi:hypothetical protein
MLYPDFLQEERKFSLRQKLNIFYCVGKSSRVGKGVLVKLRKNKKT